MVSPDYFFAEIFGMCCEQFADDVEVDVFPLGVPHRFLASQCDPALVNLFNLVITLYQRRI
ncbi:hypothetical protein HRbin03_00216 [archaeon HR03]|nr:hypothetical protein HRbin03_00216 [archaeon HR03]